MAIKKGMFNLYFFIYEMYLVNGISKDIYDTVNKLQDVSEYYKRRIIFRLLMNDISNTKRYDTFKEGLTHSYMVTDLYHQIKFVG